MEKLTIKGRLHESYNMYEQMSPYKGGGSTIPKFCIRTLWLPPKRPGRPRRSQKARKTFVVFHKHAVRPFPLLCPDGSAHLSPVHPGEFCHDRRSAENTHASSRVQFILQ